MWLLRPNCIFSLSVAGHTPPREGRVLEQLPGAKAISLAPSPHGLTCPDLSEGTFGPGGGSFPQPFPGYLTSSA